MGVAFTNLLTGNSGNNAATSYTTASITPPANKPIYISITSRDALSVQNNVPTVSGCNLSWVQVATIYFDTDSSSRKTLTLLRALGGSPTTGTLTIDFGGQTQSDATWIIDYADGADISGGNGSNSVVQSVTNKDEVSGGGTISVTLASFSSPNNVAYATAACDSNSTFGVGSMTAGTGYTKITDTCTNQIHGTEYDLANVTAASATFPTAAGAKMGIIAIEVKAASISPQPSIKPNHPKINWGNPLTKGLVFDVPLFDVASQSPFDVVNGLRGSQTNFLSWVQKLFGPSLSFNGSGSAGQLVSYTTPSGVNTLHQMTAEGILYSNSSGGGTNGRFLHKKNGATYWKIQMQSTNTTMEFDIDCTSTFPAWHWTIPSGQWFHLVVSYDDSSNGNVPNVWINGVPVTVTTDVSRTEARIADDANLYVGNYATAAKTWDGYIVYARIWNRVLTSTEVKALYTNPWQIYVKPNFTPFYNSNPVVGGTAVKMQAVRGWSWAI